jgi:hypothetical protein
MVESASQFKRQHLILELNMQIAAGEQAVLGSSTPDVDFSLACH